MILQANYLAARFGVEPRPRWIAETGMVSQASLNSAAKKARFSCGSDAAL